MILKIGNRNLNKILKSVTQRRHYIALINMLHFYPAFTENLFRYLTARGRYPYDIKIKSPIGILIPKLYSHHDLLTVNEIFCRLDYSAGYESKVIVDLGSNIGISALYFLSRNHNSKCYLYEPDPKNIKKLYKNLSNFSHRYILTKKAVSDKKGQLEFGVEPTGRYGGIGIKTGNTITVDCLNINDVLRNVLSKEQWIDILKIDTEGVEIKTVEAIEKDILKRIKKIYLEATPHYQLHPTTFRQKQYGTVCQLANIHPVN